MNTESCKITCHFLQCMPSRARNICVNPCQRGPIPLDYRKLRCQFIQVILSDKAAPHQYVLFTLHTNYCLLPYVETTGVKELLMLRLLQV